MCSPTSVTEPFLCHSDHQHFFEFELNFVKKFLMYGLLDFFKKKIIINYFGYCSVKMCFAFTHNVFLVKLYNKVTLVNYFS